ncbi:MAG: hypothetical protein JKY56_22355 [Kofleriaceae bacterium]|nr:hypothetical protein [Kofleriaceae bacterium]
MSKTQSSLLPSLRQILLTSCAVALVLGAQEQAADAQPGLTPPGSVAPPAPAPVYRPGPPPTAPPAPYPAPATARPPGPPPGPPPATYPQGGYPGPQQYAQPPSYGYQPPMHVPAPPPRRLRTGFNFGLNLGLGDMSSSDGELLCNGCSETPVTVAFGFHVGVMLAPNVSMVGEIWGQARPLDENNDLTLGQTLYLVGLQYWLSDRFWVKGALGASTLSVTEFGERTAVDEGSAGMLAIGYELSHSPTFAWDIQIKSGAGFYENGEAIESTTLTTGITWY